MEDSDRLHDLINHGRDEGPANGSTENDDDSRFIENREVEAIVEEINGADDAPKTTQFEPAHAPQRKSRLRRAADHGDGAQAFSDDKPGSTRAFEPGSREAAPTDDEGVKIFTPPAPAGERKKKEPAKIPGLPAEDDPDVNSVVFDTDKPGVGSLKDIADTAERKDSDAVDEQIKGKEVDEKEVLEKIKREKERKAKEFAESSSVPDLDEQIRQEGAPGDDGHFEPEDETPVIEEIDDGPLGGPAYLTPAEEEAERKHRDHDSDRIQDGFFAKIFRTREPIIRLDDEYRSTADTAPFGAMLSGKLGRHFKRSIILSAIAFVTLVFDLVVSGIVGAAVAPFGGNMYIYALVNAALLLAAIVVDGESFIAGFAAVRDRKYDVALISVMTYLSGVLQLIGAFIKPGSAEIVAHIYTAACIFGGAELSWSRFFAFKSVSDSFSAHRLGGRLVIKKVTGRKDLNEIATALLTEENDVRYSVKTDFVSDLAKRVEDGLVAVLPYPALICIALGAGVVAAVIAAIRTKSVLGAFTGFTMSTCLSLPLCSIVTMCYALSVTNLKLKRKLSYISGYDTARDLSHTEFVLVREEDVFDVRCTGVDLAEDVPALPVAFCAYVMLSREGGVIAEAMKDYLPALIETDEYQDLVTKKVDVDDFFPEGSGCSGWIGNNRIFLGSAEYLQSHTVKLPEEVLREDGANEITLHLAIAQRYYGAIHFSVEIEKGTTAALEPLISRGVTLIVRRVNDGFTEEKVAGMLNIPDKNLKVVSGRSGAFLNEESEGSASEPAGAVHHGKLKSSLELILASVKLNDSSRIAKLLSVIFTIAGALITVAVCAINRLALMNEGIVAAAMIVFCAIGIAAFRAVTGRKN